ncbi:hypothetical protein ACFC3O_16655, partial [Streptomyces sp. NPDC056007]|uniref:hypothetical protein n=1 Tax=Streptomyces sp. NPDC056007 TaxID=3345678 RepID=UPI0035E04816
GSEWAGGSAWVAGGGGERAALRTAEGLSEGGAVPPPPGADTAHAALYEVPRLLCLYAREREGALIPE